MTKRAIPACRDFPRPIGEDAGQECPACHLIKDTFKGKAGQGSSHSRYVDVYICSDCGCSEALRGFFWASHCPAALITASAKRRGITIAELINM